MLRTVRHLLELIRFSHTLFALPFALLAAVMAWRISGFSWRELSGIVLCMVTARSFAMSVNRLVDRRIDAQNPRTAGRHLPAGILNVGVVQWFAAANAIGLILATLLFLPNRLPLYLSVPLLTFLASYSYTKRFTALSHFWLGASLALSPLAAWVAIRGEALFELPIDFVGAVILGVAVLLWVAGFDMIYACQDSEFDRRQGLYSVPAQAGIPRALQIAAECHVGAVIALALLPLAYPLFGWIYWAGVAAVTLLLVYEHLLVRPDDLSRVNAAFFNVNAVISLGLFAVGSLDLWIRGG